MPIEDKDMELLKEIFVTRRECTDTHDGVKADMSLRDQRLAKIEAQTNTVVWVSKTTLAAAIGAIVIALFNLILK